LFIRQKVVNLNLPIIFAMETLLLNSKSTSDLKLLADLAKKLGVSVRYLKDEEIEDIGMLRYLDEVDRTEVVTRDQVMAKLGKL
jgi:hypothetical protein